MIKIQEQAAKMTDDALEMILRTAKFIPEDKLDWTPMGSARTVLNQLAEIIQFAERLAWMLTADIIPPTFDREQYFARRKQIMAQCPDLARVDTMARAKHTELHDVIMNTLDSKLEQEFHLPFFGGMTVTGADMLFLAYWNLTYHTGQINYIQAMLGDTDMH